MWPFLFSLKNSGLLSEIIQPQTEKYFPPMPGPSPEPHFWRWELDWGFWVCGREDQRVSI